MTDHTDAPPGGSTVQYRNDTGSALTVATEPPLLVHPGDVVDVDGHVTGLTPVDADGNPTGETPAAVLDARFFDDPAAYAANLADADAAATDDQQDPEATR